MLLVTGPLMPLQDEGCFPTWEMGTHKIFAVRPGKRGWDSSQVTMRAEQTNFLRSLLLHKAIWYLGAETRMLTEETTSACVGVAGTA